MSLIKKANDTIVAKTDPVTKAMLEMMGDSPKEEMIKIADHWRTEGKDLDLNDLRERIATELEMLEYRPEEVATMTTRILKMIGRAL